MTFLCPLLIPAQAEVPSMGWLIAKTLLLLVLLGGIMFLLFRFGGRWMALPFFPRPQKGPMELKGSLPLSPGRILHIVEIHGEELLIGSSEKGLELLSRFVVERQGEENNHGDD